MARQQRGLPPDRVADPAVAPDDARQRRRSAQEGGAGPCQDVIGAAAAGEAGRLVDHQSHVAGGKRTPRRPVARLELEHRIGIGECGGFIGRHDQQGVGAGGHVPGGGIDAGTQIQQHHVIAVERADRLQQSIQQAELQRRHRGGARPARQDVERRGRQLRRYVPDDDLLQAAPSRQHRGQVLARRQAELDVDVGEAEVAIDEQHGPAPCGQALRQGNRQPRLADAALA